MMLLVLHIVGKVSFYRIF